MKELTLLEKKVIILLTYEISNTSDTISKNNLTDIINNIKLKKYTKRPYLLEKRIFFFVEIQNRIKR